MTRTIVALLIPAALLLGACSAESTTTEAESPASATTEATEASSADLPAVADLCKGLLQYTNGAEARAQQSGETFDRTKALDDLFTQSAETPEWKDAPQERKDQMIQAYDAAKTGAC
ncbi:hypothetical protein [Rhodococcus opacus]|uniref:hypothetical protein n=1 Tax=Rhodococcus opacus TaxID=37919 RepID=UPI00247324A5|nr:hypothetical protein [Rhodococcus opacus]MDH6285470.1 PBP1b-binding outer membrane lipoprotein LpoB [Rhodococcus opacus]